MSRCKTGSGCPRCSKAPRRSTTAAWFQGVARDPLRRSWRGCRSDGGGRHRWGARTVGVRRRYGEGVGDTIGQTRDQVARDSPCRRCCRYRPAWEEKRSMSRCKTGSGCPRAPRRSPSPGRFRGPRRHWLGDRAALPRSRDRARSRRRRSRRRHRARRCCSLERSRKPGLRDCVSVTSPPLTSGPLTFWTVPPAIGTRRSSSTLSVSWSAP